MIRLIKVTITSIVEIVLLFFLYRVFFDYFPFTQPAGPFMIDGDHYLITPISFSIGTFILNFIFFHSSNRSKIQVSIYALAFAILTMLIFTAVYAIHTSPSFYFMFTFKMGIYFFCWLVLGAVIQSIGFHLMSKKRA